MKNENNVGKFVAKAKTLVLKVMMSRPNMKNFT